MSFRRRAARPLSSKIRSERQRHARSGGRATGDAEAPLDRGGDAGRAKRQGVAVSFVADFPSKIRIDDIAKNTRNEILPVKFDENGSLTMA